MNKKLSIAFILMMTLVGGYFGYQKYQENETKKFNEAYQNQLTLLMGNAHTLTDSIDVLKPQLTLINLPPQSEQLYPEVKAMVTNTYQQLMQTKADIANWEAARKKHSIGGYTDYIVQNRDGRYVQEAQTKIEEIENKQRVEAVAASYNSGNVNTAPSGQGNRLVFTKLICNEQQENKSISGQDRMTLVINGKKYLNATDMETGQVENLDFIEAIPLHANSMIPILLKEEDDWLRDDVMMNFSITGNKHEKGTYKKVGTHLVGGNYTLVYEIK